MTKDKGIIIKNVYYMLAYAYQSLQQQNYEDIATENFDNIEDLFASILEKGIASQLKQGLNREYIEKKEVKSTLRGKIDITNTIKLKMQKAGKLACEYDDLSENNVMNQILKTTVFKLFAADGIKPENKAALKRYMLYFSEVELLEPSSIQWSRLRYHRNNQTYRMLMNICYLVLVKLLLSTEKGKVKFATFLDTQAMSRLYEKFILEYYRKHYPQFHAAPSQIPWNVDDDYIDFLPVMQTDISLVSDDYCLIIDAKYYGKTMQQIGNFDTRTVHSNNLYQIFTYVKNRDKYRTGKVSGMLLYAKTDEDITPDNIYLMSGNRISVKTLDLNRRFEGIAQQLNDIGNQFVQESAKLKGM